MKYRSDIDGIRALAVTSVVIFHTGLFIKGGYLGVDIFFVISGYLITSKILADLESNDFSFSEFYKARVRRILPALAVVLFATFPLGYWLLPPNELAIYAKTLAASIFSVSNIIFWTESGYFDFGTSDYPLIHTWSLGIEEQFYMVFPVVFFLLFRIARSFLPIALLTSFLLSLGASEYLSHVAPSANFYLLPSRGWELLMGSLMVYVQRAIPAGSKLTRFLPDLGLALIVLSISFVDETTRAPSLLALPVVLGSGLMLAFPSDRSFSHRILTITPVVYVGKISYSIYLWHQPVFSFARLYNLESIGAQGYIFLSAAILCLSSLTWWFVENRFRSRRYPFSKTARFTVGMAAIISSLSITLYFLSAHAGRLPGRPTLPGQLEKIVDDRSFCRSGAGKIDGLSVGCFVGPLDRPAVALIGDSHALAISGALSYEVASLNKTFINLSINGCIPLLNVDSLRFDGRRCQPLQTEAINFAIRNDNIDTIVLAGYWSAALGGAIYDNGEGGIVRFDEQGKDWRLNGETIKAGDLSTAVKKALVQTINILSQSKKHIIVLSQIPEPGWIVPRRIYAELLNGRAPDASTAFEVYNNRNGILTELLKAQRQVAHFDLIQPSRYLCDAARGRCKSIIDGRAAYFDHNHLSRVGAEPLAKAIGEAIINYNRDQRAR